MRKTIALFLVMVMCFSVTACSGGNQQAFDASKAAYDNVDIAYEITEQIGSDIYEAWLLAIFEEDEVRKDGAEHLAKTLSLSADEIRAGVAYSLIEMMGLDWDTVPEEDKNTYIGVADETFAAFGLLGNEVFSLCVASVSNAYIANGKVGEAQTALDAAKAQMKELSAEYSDYEHYPNLKGYFTTTSSFFDFCQNPTGSFEQVKDTINDYKNEARDYISDLDYIFEE